MSRGRARREPSTEIPGSSADGQGGTGPESWSVRIDHRSRRVRPRLQDGDQAQDPLRAGPHHPGEQQAVPPQRRAAKAGAWMMDVFFGASKSGDSVPKPADENTGRRKG